MTSWQAGKVAAPLAFATTKGTAYAMNYFADPKHVKSTTQESVAGLLKDPGFAIAVGMGLAEGGLIKYGALKTLQVPGKTMADVNKTIGYDMVFGAALSAVSSNIGRALDGEKVLTPRGIQKTLAASLNGAADTPVTGSIFSGGVYPVKTTEYLQTPAGKFLAQSFAGFKDPALWQQSMVRFGLGSGADTLNQLANASGDVKKLNLGNTLISGVQASLSPAFLASIQKVTIQHNQQISHLLPNLFKINGSKITSQFTNTESPHLAYLSRYLVYGLEMTMLKKELKNHGVLSVDSLLFAENRTKDLLNSPKALAATLNSNEFKAATQHLESMPPLMRMIAVGAYHPNEQTTTLINKLLTTENGQKALSQIQIPTNQQASDLSPQINQQIKQLSNTLKLSQDDVNLSGNKNLVATKPLTNTENSLDSNSSLRPDFSNKWLPFNAPQHPNNFLALNPALQNDAKPLEKPDAAKVGATSTVFGQREGQAESGIKNSTGASPSNIVQPNQPLIDPPKIDQIRETNHLIAEQARHNLFDIIKGQNSVNDDHTKINIPKGRGH